MEQYGDDGRDEYGQGMELQFAMYPPQEAGMAAWEYLRLWERLRQFTFEEAMALTLHGEILKGGKGEALEMFKEAMLHYATSIPGTGITKAPTDETQH